MKLCGADEIGAIRADEIGAHQPRAAGEIGEIHPWWALVKFIRRR